MGKVEIIGVAGSLMIKKKMINKKSGERTH